MKNIQTNNINYIICKYCENICSGDNIYDLSDKKDNSDLMCIDCIYETYYHLELS